MMYLLLLLLPLILLRLLLFLHPDLQHSWVSIHLFISILLIISLWVDSLYTLLL
jgi:hypothetical protein